MTRHQLEVGLRDSINRAEQAYSGYHRPNDVLAQLITARVMAMLDGAGLLNALTEEQPAVAVVLAKS